MLIKQIVDDTKNNIKAKIAMQAEIDAAEDDEAAEVDMNVPAAITAWSAPATRSSPTTTLLSLSSRLLPPLQ